MKTRLLFLVIVMLTFIVSGSAMAQQAFDFNGMALLPAAEGGTLTMYSIVRDAFPILTPIPLDFDNYEYTLVVTDLVLDVDGITQFYSNGTMVIYQDDMTLADFADGSSFTNGSIILSGVITTLTHNLLPWLSNGSFSGLVNWTGGDNLNDIAPEDQIGWRFLGGTSNAASSVEPGYDEAWDGKVEPEDLIVDVDKVTWDELKAMF